MSGVNLSIIIPFVYLVRQFACFIRLVGQIRIQFGRLAGQFTCFIRLVWKIRIQFVHLAGQFTCIRLVGQIIIQSLYLARQYS